MKISQSSLSPPSADSTTNGHFQYSRSLIDAATEPVAASSSDATEPPPPPYQEVEQPTVDLAVSFRSGQQQQRSLTPSACTSTSATSSTSPRGSRNRSGSPQSVAREEERRMFQTLQRSRADQKRDEQDRRRQLLNRDLEGVSSAVLGLFGQDARWGQRSIDGRDSGDGWTPRETRQRGRSWIGGGGGWVGGGGGAGGGARDCGS